MEPAKRTFRIEILHEHITLDDTLINLINSVSDFCTFQGAWIYFFFSDLEKVNAHLSKLILKGIPFKLVDYYRNYIMITSLAYSVANPVKRTKDISHIHKALNRIIFSYHATPLPPADETDKFKWLSYLPKDAALLFVNMSIDELQLVEPFIRYYREEHLGLLNDYIKSQASADQYKLWIENTTSQ